MLSPLGRRDLLVQGLGVALAAAGVPARAAPTWPRYRITDLGDLGGDSIIVSGLNEHGVAVGMATRHDGDNKGVAFLSEAGKMRGLRMEQHSVSSWGAAINAAGVVAGHDTANADANYLQSAWTWQGAERQYFSKHNSRDSTFTTDINDDGVVTGFLYPGSGVLWRDGQMVDLSAETGLVIVKANAINAAGDVVGISQQKKQSVSFIYRDGAAARLDILGSTEHEALDINATGQVCGHYRPADEDRVGRGYLWNNGVAIDLGQLPGPKQTLQAQALNDAGTVVGTSAVAVPGSPRQPHAFVWQDGTMADLNRLIDGDHDGWVLNKAVDINNVGQIVGQGMHHGVPRAFLATPVA